MTESQWARRVEAVVESRWARRVEAVECTKRRGQERGRAEGNSRSRVHALGMNGVEPVRIDLLLLSSRKGQDSHGECLDRVMRAWSVGIKRAMTNLVRSDFGEA
jgi:hypothetical protein